MTATLIPRHDIRTPRLGGLFLRAARRTTALMRPLAGKRWNPIFSIVRHSGRRSGRTFETPVAARRVEGGFVLALAFGPTANWYRNLVANGGGVIRWRGIDVPVAAPARMAVEEALAAFLPIQRAGLRAAGIDGYIRVMDEPATPSASGR